jgi:hypothetical protein
MTVDEVDVAADGLFEQFQHAVLRVLPRHRRHGILEVLRQFEDHDFT